MTPDAQHPPRRKYRLVRFLLWLIALPALLLAIAMTIIFLAYTGPSVREIQQVKRQYQTVRALYPAPSIKAGNPVTTSPTHANQDPPFPLTTATAMRPAASGETDQQRCDSLFREIIHIADERMLLRELEFRLGFDLERCLASRQQARDLAALDARGIRVSDAARREYKEFHGRILGQFSDILARGYEEVSDPYRTLDPYRDPLNARAGEPLKLSPAEVQDLIEALHFLHGSGCPAMPCFRPDERLEALERIERLLDPGEENWPELPPIPREILALDPELLAPRSIPGWNVFLGQCLDAQQDVLDQSVEAARPIGYYRQEVARAKRDRPDLYRRRFDVRAEANFKALRDSFTDFTQHQRTAKYQLQWSQKLLDYAQAASAGSTIQAVDEGILLHLKNHNHQIQARALAAALSLRQGKPVPARGSVTPDSFFWDPVTRQPLRLYQSPAGPGIVRLYLAWPVHEENRDAGILKVPLLRRVYSLTVLLPASHPGLQSVPELRSP